MDTFYLGIHHVDWVGKTDVPTFLSARRLMRAKTLPRARGRVVMDSGGFTMIRDHGRYTVSGAEYADFAERAVHDIGTVDWVACQDWMCEPSIIERTGLSVAEHQRRTIASYLELMSLKPAVPWAPVLQGQHPADFTSHVGQYRAAGVALETLPIVGLGTVCGRQKTVELLEISRPLAEMGIRLHGFGVKTTGLMRCRDWFTTADSMAWSYAGRWPDNRCSPNRTHKKCANCLDWALRWRRRIVNRLSQGQLWEAA